jgi:hypothetical protein
MKVLKMNRKNMITIKILELKTRKVVDIQEFSDKDSADAAFAQWRECRTVPDAYEWTVILECDGEELASHIPTPGHWQKLISEGVFVDDKYLREELTSWNQSNFKRETITNEDWFTFKNKTWFNSKEAHYWVAKKKDKRRKV